MVTLFDWAIVKYTMNGDSWACSVLAMTLIICNLLIVVTWLMVTVDRLSRSSVLLTAENGVYLLDP